MNIKFEKISKTEFNKIDNAIVLLEKSSDDNFGKIQWEEKVFLFGWRGDFILPVIKEIDSFRFGLGIDLNFIIVDSQKKEIIFLLELDEYFINFIVNKDEIYIASELKIIELDVDNLDVSNEFYLDEIFDNFIVTSDSVKVSCIDNQIINLNK